MNKRRFGHSYSIGTRILLNHVALCVVIIAVVSVLSYTYSINSLHRTTIETLTEQAQMIADSVCVDAESGFAPDAYRTRLFEHLLHYGIYYIDAGRNDQRVFHFADDGESYRSQASKMPEVEDYIDRTFADRILSGETASSVYRFEFARDNVIFAGIPILSGGGEVLGGMVMAMPVSQTYRLSRIFRFILSFSLGVSLLLAVILAIELTQILVRPIKRITTAARRMEAGIYAEQIEQLPDDEIGELGRALNSMSAKLMEVIGSLRKERDKLELIISGIDEGLVGVDTQWNIVHANAAFLELTETDSAGEFLLDSPESARFLPLRALLERCMQSGTVEREEWTTPSGRAISAKATVVRDDLGVIIGAVCLMDDVSEAQRLEQLRRDYVANISHELRTPLTGIRGMVEPLIDGCMITEEERMDSYRIILKETMRLEKLVGDMLDMSRLQDGRLKVELEPMELPGILEAAVRTMKPIADDAGVRLSFETDGSPLACLGNEDRIMQVLVILIDNALSFTPRGGSVVVFGRDGAQYVSVGVRDTGSGIEPKDLPLIWERFYKADKSRMRTTGTGLGLPIARLVTQLMGGAIDVKSEPGHGAEFTFTLKKFEPPRNVNRM